MSPSAVLLSFSIFVASGLEELKVKPGEDALLQCQSPGGGSIILLEWSRPELQSEGYVFFYRNKRPYEKYQHESFKGRVELRDPNMKDGDVSVTVRNVSIRDTGTYDCEITTRDKGGVTAESKHSVNLTVTDSGFTDEDTEIERHKDGGDMDGRDRDKTVLITVGVFMVFGLILLIACVNNCRKSKRFSNSNPVGSAEP